MLRLTSLTNVNARRTLRPLYAQTQAYPYAVKLSSAFDRTAMFNPVQSGPANAKAAILPGLIATKLAGEVVTVAEAQDDERNFGLFANFVGGELTDIPPESDDVGVWRGSGSVFELLAPVFDDTGLSTVAANEDGTGPLEAYGVSNSAGQVLFSSEIYDLAEGPPVARLISYLSANAIIVELLV